MKAEDTKPKGMKSALYTIETISNLHVGSGEVNFGVVDNLIQRDVITGLPVINSSSLKGAFRQHYKNLLSTDAIEATFGSEAKDPKRSAGKFRFFDSYLLALPVRSDKRPYFMATCPLVLKEFITKCKLFGIELTEEVEELLSVLPTISKELEEKYVLTLCESYEGALIEDINTEAHYSGSEDIKKLEALKHILGDSPIILVKDKEFSNLCDNSHLPVIARNYLNDGKSENLFYEQVLPRLSSLYFILMYPEENDISAFNSKLKSNLIQIGANASVGYGYCKVTPFNN